MAGKEREEEEDNECGEGDGDCEDGESSQGLDASQRTRPGSSFGDSLGLVAIPEILVRAK